MRRVVFSFPVALVCAALTVLSLPGVPADIASWGPVFGWIDESVWRYALPALGWLGLLGLVIWLLRGHRRGDDHTKALGRRVLVELATIASTVESALAEGRWWNVNVTGLPSEQWHAAADTLSAKLHDALFPVYVEADQLNKLSNRHFWSDQAQRQLSDDARQRLQSFRASVAKATSQLRRSLR